MKRIYKIICFLLLGLINLPILSQNQFEKNLEKYWFYRERLKNFVVVGDGVGCSNISNAIDPPGTLNYNDHTQVLGNYIGMLSMEHYLLKSNSQDLSENTKELFYAIEAINRLDKMAETYWCSPRFGTFGSTYNYTGYTPNIQNDLNGFFIRDETPYNLLDFNYNGMLMENHLGNHWAPFQDGRRKMRMAGSYTDREYFTTNNVTKSYGGPTEMSLDQVIELTGGLILAAKFVDQGLHYPGHVFSDGESNFIQEVKNICHRISERCKANGWTIKNPVTGQCVKALNFQGNSCQDGGAKFGLLSEGYARANARIEDDFQVNGTYWLSHYAGQTSNSSLWGPSGLFIQAAPPLNAYEDTKVLLLAAISDIWGPLTLPVVTDRSYRIYNEATINFPHYPLLNCILYNKTSLIPDDVYKCMLNTADPDGQTNYRFNYEWNDQRLIYGANSGHTNYSSDRWGEYMYYFNMYCIYNPSYMNGQYKKIDPLELCKNEIIKTGYTEWDWKKFAAVDKITAGNINNSGNYIVKQYDGSQTGQIMCRSADIGNYVPYATYTVNPGNTGFTSFENLCNYDQIENTDPTKVTFLAGNQVALLPGLEVHSGAEMDVYTQDNLELYNGNQTDLCIPCSNCKINGSEAVTGTNSDYSDNKFYKVYSFIPGELLVVTPHVIFKVREDGSIAENMFGINIDGSGNCPSDYQINGMNTLIGYQRFKDPLIGNHGIVDVDFYKGYTFISFADGRILRVKSTGGIGANMFGVSDDNSSLNFNLVSGALNYDQAWHRFNHDIFDTQVANGEFLIAFNRSTIGGLGQNSHIYKFNSVGYVSNNLQMMYNPWQVNENNLSSIYGSAYFMGKISCMRYLDNKLFIATRNNGTAKGKLLKVNNTGGTGQNMFGVIEYGNNSTFAFANNFSSVYYLGDERFGGNTGSNEGSYITEMFYFNNETYIGFRNGKAFRITGTGGTGHHMFNVDEYNSSFTNHDNNSTHYLQSFQDYSDGSGALLNKSYIRVIQEVNQALLVGLHDGQLFKYYTFDSPSYNGQLATQLGHSNFETSIVSMTKVIHGCPGGENPDDYVPRREVENGDICYCGINVFIGMAGHQILGVRSSGGLNENFYEVIWRNQQTGLTIGTNTEKEGFVSKCGSPYFLGSQNFKEICAGARLAADSSLAEEKTPLSESEYLAMAEETMLANQYDYSYFYDMQLWPNPSNGDNIKIKLTSPNDEILTIKILDVVGKEIKQIEIATNIDQHVALNLNSGIYYLTVNPNASSYSILKKLVIQ